MVVVWQEPVGLGPVVIIYYFYSQYYKQYNCAMHIREHVKNVLHFECISGGSEFVGVELNPWLVLYSKLVALKRFGTKTNVRFLRKDIWKYDLRKHDTVIVFGVECMMEELRLKSEEELQRGTTVVACRFPFESWTPTKVEGEGIDTVWLYER